MANVLVCTLYVWPTELEMGLHIELDVLSMQFAIKLARHTYYIVFKCCCCSNVIDDPMTMDIYICDFQTAYKRTYKSVY